MTREQKEQLLSRLDEIANDVGMARHNTPSANLEEVGRHLEIALDLLDGEPAEIAMAETV